MNKEEKDWPNRLGPSPIKPQPDYANGQTWTIDSRPESKEPHKCTLPGWWDRHVNKITPGTIVRCLVCQKSWQWVIYTDFTGAKRREWSIYVRQDEVKYEN